MLGLAIEYARRGMAALSAVGPPEAAPPLLPPPPQTVVPAEDGEASVFEHRLDPDLGRPGEGDGS